MSTPQSRSDTRAAAKRRAAARRRNREVMRRTLAIVFVIIFVCGTATTAFVFSQQGTTTTNAVPTNVSGQQTSATPSADVAGSLARQADDAVAKGDLDSAISFYNAALGLSPGNATLQYKLGKAQVQQGDYTNGVANLQEALSSNPSASFAADAQKLIDENKGKKNSITPVGTPGAATTPGAAGTVAPATTP